MIIFSDNLSESSFPASLKKNLNPFMSYPTALPVPFRKNPRGFSLIEVLIVIAIIAILMTGGAIGMKHIVAGKNTSTAVSVSESLFSEARGIAIAKRVKARVMIDVDEVNSDNYLRRVVIAYQEINDAGSVVADSWVLAGRGYQIPGGAYFSLAYSQLYDADTSAWSDIPTENITGGDFNTKYAGTYAYYEFNAEGIFQNPGSSFVVGAGVRGKEQTNPKVTKSAEKDFSGFVIWRNGRTSVYRSPKHIEDQLGKDLPTPGQTF
jgi:prepilin-type N-terminal cleavage/methylation domain-containing protein